MSRYGYCKHGNTGICYQCIQEGDKAEFVNLGYCEHGTRAGGGAMCMECFMKGAVSRTEGYCKHGNTGICYQCVQEGDEAEFVNLGYCEHGTPAHALCRWCMERN